MTGSKLYLVQHYEREPNRMPPVVGLTDEERELLEEPEYTGYHKIGVAKEPERRLSALRGGTPHKLRLVTTVEVNGDAEAAEEELHSLLDTLNYRREWFCLHPKHVDSLKRLDEVSPEELAEARRRVYESDRWPLETTLLDEIEAVRGGEE